MIRWPERKSFCSHFHPAGAIKKLALFYLPAADFRRGLVRFRERLPPGGGIRNSKLITLNSSLITLNYCTEKNRRVSTHKDPSLRR